MKIFEKNPKIYNREYTVIRDSRVNLTTVVKQFRIWELSFFDCSAEKAEIWFKSIKYHLTLIKSKIIKSQNIHLKRHIFIGMHGNWNTNRCKNYFIEHSENLIAFSDGLLTKKSKVFSKWQFTSQLQFWQIV